MHDTVCSPMPLIKGKGGRSPPSRACRSWPSKLTMWVRLPSLAQHEVAFPALLANLGPEIAKQFSHEQAQGLFVSDRYRRSSCRRAAVPICYVELPPRAEYLSCVSMCKNPNWFTHTEGVSHEWYW